MVRFSKLFSLTGGRKSSWRSTMIRAGLNVLLLILVVAVVVAVVVVVVSTDMMLDVRC